MKDIDNIEDWYRDELNNYNVEPDANGWNSIAENLDANTPLTDSNISEWYKKEAAKLEERPDYTVWDKLSSKLDTTSVWDKLAVSLDKYELFIWWRNIAIKGTAVLLLLLGSYLTYENFNKQNTLAENNQTTFTKESNLGFASLLGAEHKLNSNFPKSVFTTSSEANNSSNTNTITENINPSTKNSIAKTITSTKKGLIGKSNSNHNERPLYASVEKIKHYNSISIENLNALKTNQKRNIFTDFNRRKITERDISHIYESSGFLVKKDKNKILFNKRRFSSHSTFGLQSRRIYVGVNMGLKKQGMISQLKENSPLAAYEQKSLLDFGTNFGGVIGMVISSNLNIETSINFNSTAGYKRAFSTEGASFQENLNINYTSVNLLAKKMNSRSTFDNRIYSTNFIGGVYASFLRTATSDINGVTRNLDEYNTTDFGIVLGIEQDRYITKTLVITPGIRYNQGLTNIANDNSSFEAARNFSFEFNLGVKYIFTK